MEQEANEEEAVRGMDIHTNMTTGHRCRQGKKRSHERHSLRSPAAVTYKGSLKLAQMSCGTYPVAGACTLVLHKAPFTPLSGLWSTHVTYDDSDIEKCKQ